MSTPFQPAASGEPGFSRKSPSDMAGEAARAAVHRRIAEFDAIEASCVDLSLTVLPPSSPARSLIRLGRARNGGVTARLVDEVQSVSERLRAVVP